MSKQNTPQHTNPNENDKSYNNNNNNIIIIIKIKEREILMPNDDICRWKQMKDPYLVLCSKNLALLSLKN